MGRNLKVVTEQTFALEAPRQDRLVAMFLAGKSKNTLEAYRRDLGDFAAFVGVDTLDAVAQVLLSRDHGAANGLALDYRNHLMEQGLAPSTVNRRLAALRSLVKLGNTLGLVPWRLSVDGVKSQAYRDTAGPGLEGYQAMLAAAAAQRTPKAQRDGALLRLLHDRGLRRGEVAALDVEDLNLGEERATVTIIGKGRTEPEAVTINEPTRKALVAWLEARGDEPGPLFTTLDHRSRGNARITGTGIYKVVQVLANLAGLDARVRPHGLRHTAITTLLDKTQGDVRAVQRFSRHKDIKVVLTYDDNRRDVGGEMAALLAED